MKNAFPLSFVIVGSGWRAMFFVRVAKRYPDLFRLKYVLCRTQEKAELISREQGIPTTVSEEVCEAAHPDFVVVAVKRSVNYDVMMKWLKKGYAVLAETPAADQEEHLVEFWNLTGNGARLQIAEQYIRYPLLAAGLRAVKENLLGDPYAVELSLAHDYHGISLIRHMLNCGLDRQESLPAVKLWAKQYHFPVTETDSRFGPITDGKVLMRERTRVTMEFENGKTAFYDFSGVQYHSFIRSRHINLQGQNGEWNDTYLRYLDAFGRPVLEQLRPYLDPAYAALDTEELRALSAAWNPAVHMENLQDEYAIASLMFDMREYLETGKEIYPLAEALEDAYLMLLIKKALKNPGQEVVSAPMVWQEK